MQGASEQDSTELMVEYLDIMKNQERVDYLMVLQGAVDKMVEKESLESPAFLADARNVSLIKQRLTTEEGIREYAQYLGEKQQETNAAMNGENWTLYSIVTYVVLAAFISMAVVLICQSIWKRLMVADPQATIGQDCQQAILKKERLEQIITN